MPATIFTIIDMSTEHLFEGLGKYNDVVDLFHKETDRAAAILAGSYLEVLLESLLKSTFVNDPVVEELFKGSGPLATFSSRISFSYALGLIDGEVYRDLNIIRRIRNHFAHNIQNASFEDASIRDRCGELSFVKLSIQSGIEDVASHGPRNRFLLSVGYLTLVITKPVHDRWLGRHPSE